MAEKSLVYFCSFCGLILFSSCGVSATELTSDMVRRWAKRIGSEAAEFTENVTGAKNLKQAYENFTLTPGEAVDNEVLNNMREEMKVFFSSKTSSLKKLVKKAEDAYCKYKYNKNLKLSEEDYPNAKDLDKYLNKSGLKLEYNSTFKNAISFNKSVVHVPTDVYNGASEIVNGISWTSELDTVFDNNRHDDPSLSWQYFGSDKGFMRTYPAKRWDNNNPNHVDLYDARLRPWYIQGATSPKNIIILIDASGSMHGVPMRIAKLSARNLIDTFGDNDFFNVVYFNSKVSMLCLCDGTGPILLQATKRNKMYVKSRLQDIEDGNVAMWKDGMDKAFELLKKANNCALCQQAIMVLSDGTTSSLTELFAERNPDKKVRVFTFAVGPPAESTEALRNMACSNRGYFSRIPSVGAVREVSENYIRVLTRPMAKANATDHTVWTSVYLDALGLGMMVTGTLPVFHRIEDASDCESKDGMQDEEKYKDHFLGVMGTDVPLNNLKEFILQPLIGPGGYVFAVNNNGMIIFHPRLKTVYGYLTDPPGVDLEDVETSENDSNVLELRKAMIDTVPIAAEPPPSNSPSTKTFEVYDLSFDELRVTKRVMHYYFGGVEGTSFSLAIATPQLGYKYTLEKYTDEQVIAELHDQLSKESGDNINIERWPYCRNIVFSESPLEQLIKETKTGDTQLCKNGDLLTGLLVDVNATSEMPALWEKKPLTGIKEVFVRTFWGLTRTHSESQDKLGVTSQDNFFRRVLGSQTPNTSIIYASPYLAAKSEANTSSVFAYKRIFRGQYLAAVLGYEMDMDSFVEEHFVKKTKCNATQTGPECDLSCDRTGKNMYEGYYCYLLDENGFVVAGNDGNSAGKFFGRVDAPVMQQLIRSDEKSSTGVYNKVEITDFQSVCQEKGGVNSGGTSFLLQPLFSLSAYAEWWTTKAVWSLLYFNFYSWLFSETGASTEAADDAPKNVSCIRNVTTYYSTEGNILQSGKATCEGCTSDRSYVVASVPDSNLYLVVINATCGLCSDSVNDMGIPGEPRKILRETVETARKAACKEPGYRKRPQRCFASTDPETGYMCGTGSFITPSLHAITLQLLCLTVLWRIIGVV